MKLLERVLTREAPLIAIECWYDGLMDRPKEILDYFFTENVFISRHGVFECYRESQRLKELPKELAQWSKMHRKEIEFSYQKLIKAVNFFSQSRITKDLPDNKTLIYLKQIKEYFTDGFIGLFFCYWFSSWQKQLHKEGQSLFDSKVRKEAVKVREREGDRFFNEGVNIIYDILSAISQKRRWNLDILKFITYKELIQSIQQNKLPSVALNKRLNTTFAYINGKIIFEPKIDEELKSLGYEIKKEKNTTLTEFKGVIANKGIAQGKVKIVYSRNQLDKIKKGDILVAPMTSLWHIPVIQKSSAIVTDEGGITCHAAIISRELNKPCVIGIRVATQALKDDDLIEVDANKGVVKILKRKK